jgi:hypothetical protein
MGLPYQNITVVVRVFRELSVQEHLNGSCEVPEKPDTLEGAERLKEIT